MRDNPNYLTKSIGNAHRLEEIIRGSGCMTFGFDIWIIWDFKRVRSVQGIYLDTGCSSLGPLRNKSIYLSIKLAKRVQRVQYQLGYHLFL